MKHNNFFQHCVVVLAIMASLASMDVLAQDNEVSQYKYTYNTANNHNVVDLGLSVLWADCNVGASYPSEFGGLYGWADVTGSKTTLDNNLYPSYNPPMSICSNVKYDIASKKWGGAWRMPTKDEFNELITKCTWELDVLNTSGGYIVTGPNGNKIFLPLAGQRKGNKNIAEYNGMYWSGNSSLKACHGYKNAAYSLAMTGYKVSIALTPRFVGQSVRPVLPKAHVSTIKKQTRTRSLEVITDSHTTTADEVITDSHTTTADEVITDSHTTTADEVITNSHTTTTEKVITNCHSKADKVTGRRSKSKTSVPNSKKKITNNNINEDDIIYPIPSDSVPNRTHYNGPYAIDLGLSVKWADRNIDAANSYMFGKLFAWGDPIGINLGEKNYLEPDTPTDISGTKLDIARREWKGKWRLPTLDEMKELIEKCKWEWTAISGNYGYRVIGPNGNHIFLPASGCKFTYSEVFKENETGMYWTSTQKGKGKIWCLMFASKFYDIYNGKYNEGYSIRPVW